MVPCKLAIEMHIVPYMVQQVKINKKRSRFDSIVFVFAHQDNGYGYNSVLKHKPIYLFTYLLAIAINSGNPHPKRR